MFLIDRSEEFVVYGELAKWVPVSPQRVAHIETLHDANRTTCDIAVYLRGGAYEHVTFFVGKRYGPATSIDCILSSFGTAKLSVTKATCETV